MILFMPEIQYTNRLINETSPYLLQHAHNPVDWYPWGDEAFMEAKRRDVPLLASIGYSSCHWCHVMESECFENEAIAELMNRFFVNIKVDREERPDIDQIYQHAVQAMAGQGGWPLTVFLDHEKRPFFGGTYFPPVSQYGRISFPDLLETIYTQWEQERDKIYAAGRELTEVLDSGSGITETPENNLPERDLAVKAIDQLRGIVDHRYGGFNGAPKFPNPGLLQLMLRVGVHHGKQAETELVLFSIRQMARGGIYDQLGGGFHRYSTDVRWLVPHFEKMLYDNAQLLKLNIMAYQLTGDEEFKNVIQATGDYVRREMTAAEGGFYATQDADSEGEEGKYYLWSSDEVKQLLEPELAQVFQDYYRVTPEGNFEGRNILNRLESAPDGENLTTPEARRKLSQAKAILFTAREGRVKPFRDEKVITGWNGLMIGSFAYAYQVTANPLDYRSAKKAAEFILNSVKLPDGSLARIYKDGQAKITALLDDYAFLAAGLINLYEADFNENWLEQSVRLTREAVGRFGSPAGRYYLTEETGEDLINRPFSGLDQAIPSGVAVHCENLLRLAVFSGEVELKQEAERILKAYGMEMARNIWGYGSLIGALDIYHQHFKEFTFVSEGAALPEILAKFRKYFIPYRVVAWKNRPDSEAKPGDTHPARALLSGRVMVNNRAACYVCSDFRCLPPVTDWEDLYTILTQFKGGGGEGGASSV
jgi:uncharacterized protein YyaL (SSP411 family)